MLVRSSGVCDRIIDFLDFIEKWRGNDVVIGNVRIGCCRRLEPLVEFLVMRVRGVFQDVATDSEGAVGVESRVGVGLPQKCFFWSTMQEELQRIRENGFVCVSIVETKLCQAQNSVAYKVAVLVG